MLLAQGYGCIFVIEGKLLKPYIAWKTSVNCVFGCTITELNAVERVD
jgi:hypothetical protein